jgi:uncharacterized cupin superfamily protein
MSEAVFPGPPPHVHARPHDMFCVLEGTITMRLGGEEREAGPRTFVCAPPGVVHPFANRADAPARLLNGAGGSATCATSPRRRRPGRRRPRRRSAGSPRGYDFRPV